MNKIFTYKVLIFSLLLLSAIGLKGQTTFSGAGNWNDATLWSAGIPNSNSTAIIAVGSTCTINTPAVCNNLDIKGGAINTTVTLSGTNSLTVGSTVTIGAPNSNNKKTILNIDAGSLSCDSLNMPNSSGNNRDNYLNLTSGSVTVEKYLDLTGASKRCHFLVNGNGMLYIGGTFTGNGDFDPGEGTVNYNSSSDQSILSIVYYNLLITNPGISTINGGDVDGNLTVEGGTLQIIESTVLVKSTSQLNLAAGTTLKLGSESSTTNVAFPLNFVKSKVYLSSTSIIEYAANNLSQVISTIPDYGNLKISAGNSALTKTLSTGIYTVNGNLILNNGNGDLTLAVGSSTVNVAGNVEGNADLTISTGTFTLAGNYTNTGWYSQTAGTIIRAGQYSNFLISGTGTKTLADNVIINGDLTIESGTVNLNSKSLNRSSAGGTLTLQSGSGLTIDSYTGGVGSSNFPDNFTSKTLNGTVNYNGAQQQTIAPANYSTLEINNSSGVTLGGNTSISSSLILTTGTLAIGSFTLNINGQKSGNGKLKGSSFSNLSIGGSGTLDTLKFDQSSQANRTLNEITVNRSSGVVNLGDTVSISGIVTLQSGTFRTNGKLTLLSNSVSTARVGTIATGSDIIGSVTVQRYIPSSSEQKWILLSTPVSGFDYSQFIDDIFLTGPGGSVNGFDASAINSPSAYFYDETLSGTNDNGWTSPGNTNNTVASGKGLRIFYRGDRDPSRLGSNPPAPNAVTLDFVGSLNKGTISLPVSYSVSSPSGLSNEDGWNLVGNPYASQIDWNSAGWTKTNLENYVVIYNPATGTYGVWNGIIGTNNLNTGQISAGQGFFVKAKASSPALIITENAKSTGESGNLYKKNTLDEILRIKMFQNITSSDETILLFQNGASSGFNNNEDISKFNNSTLNVSSISSDNIKQAIGYVPKISVTDTINLNVGSTIPGTFQLQFSELATLGAYNIYLKDNFTNTSTDIKASNTYNFTITSDPASYGSNRFRLIINNINALPVQFLNFKGVQDSEDVLLTWITATEIANEHFEVERSFNGTIFESQGNVKGAGYSYDLNTYNFRDEIISLKYVSTLYYRIKQVDFDGRISFSEIISVDISNINHSNTVSVNPNPAREFIVLERGGFETALSYIIYDNNGAVVSASDIHLGEKINISGLRKGMYFLELTESSGKKETHKLLVSN